MPDRKRDDPQEAAREIARLQTLRGRRDRDVSITSLVAGIRKKSETTNRRQGRLIDLWQAEAPPEILNHTAIDGYRAGTLHVRVATSAVAFELDRELRNGLLATLRSQFTGTLTRVKITVGLKE